MANKVMDSSIYKTREGTSFDQGKGHKSKNIRKQKNSTPLCEM